MTERNKEAFVGKEIITNSKATLLPSGKWKVTQRCTHRMTFDGKHWEERKVEFATEDPVLAVAMDESSATLMYYLYKHKFDLFSTGFTDELPS